MSVDADISDSVDLFGKSASDLQSGIVVGDSAITGTLKYVSDYSAAFSGADASGNFLALHCETDVEGATITVEVVGGYSGPSTLDSDGLIVDRIADKSTQTIKVVASKEGYNSAVRTFSLTGLTTLSE